MMKPDTPGGSPSTMYRGKISSALVSPSPASGLTPVVAVEHQPTIRKRANCRMTITPLPMSALAGGSLRLRGEHALHDQLIGPVRRHREQRSPTSPAISVYGDDQNWLKSRFTI